MTTLHTDSSGVRFPPPGIYLIGLLAGFALEQFWPLRIVPTRIAFGAQVAGAFLIAIGLALSIWAVLVFRAVGTSPIPTRASTAVASGGPYRFTRNPMYLGLGLVSAGVAGLANALWPLLLVPLVLAVVQRLVICREERYLEHKFGESYLAYKAQVRRWL
jgi:protein-S-isoprenylcysteine O-methyltransferase Ste14